MLISSTSALLETMTPDLITVDQILAHSGVSKGSLYHHFEDITDLLEITYISRYAKWIDASISGMTKVLQHVKTKEELVDALMEVTKFTQSSIMRESRIERARTLGLANGKPRFEKALGEETKRLANSIEDLVREVIERGLFQSTLNPKVIAVFIQAYTLGKIVNDFSPEPVSDDDWNILINHIIRSSFIAQ